MQSNTFLSGSVDFCQACKASGNGRCLRSQFKCECLNGYDGTLCTIPPSTTSINTMNVYWHARPLEISTIIAIILSIVLLIISLCFIIFIIWQQRRIRMAKKSISVSSTDPSVLPPLYNISLSRTHSMTSSHIYEDLPQ